jgi:hypothetical protein
MDVWWQLHVPDNCLFGWNGNDGKWVIAENLSNNAVTKSQVNAEVSIRETKN